MTVHVVSGLRVPLWQAQLFVGLLAVGSYRLLSSPSALQVAYLAVGVFGICSVLLGLYRHRPRTPAPWWLLVAGISSWLLGDVLYTWLARASGGEPPFPSVADLVYYAFFPLVGLAHLVTLRRRLPGGDRAGLIDASLLTVAAGGLSWVYLIAPYARDQELTLLTKLASIGYPLGDLLLIALLARLLLSPGRRVPTFQLLVLAFALTLVADCVYGLQTLAGTYATGNWVDLAWMLTYVLWGTAALHPSMDQLTERAPLHTPPVARRRLALMGLAASSAPVLLIVEIARGATQEVPVLAVGCLIMFLLVLVRLAGVLDEVQSHRDRLSGALEDLEQAQEDRRVLLAQTVEAGERERARLAADLHDGPIQRLASASLVLDRALLRLDRGDATVAGELLERGHQELCQEVNALRRVMSELRPPVLDEAGLEAGIKDLLQAFTLRSGVTGSVHVRLYAPLAPEDQTVLYRVVQETLTNVGKHAAASAVSIQIAEHADSVELIVTDDGCGFVPTASSALLRGGRFGLVGMQERLQSAGGSLSVTSNPGGGTRVLAVLPRRVAAGAVQVTAPGIAPLSAGGQASAVVRPQQTVPSMRRPLEDSLPVRTVPARPARAGEPS